MSAISKVLVVDDEPSNRRIAELSLRHVGHWEVALAASGAEGLALTATFQPDVILLDVMMPGLDGLGVLLALRGDPRTSHIPVVLLTATVQRENFERLRASGAAGVLGKPFDPMALPGEIRRLVQEPQTEAMERTQRGLARADDKPSRRPGGVRSGSFPALRAVPSEIVATGSRRRNSIRTFRV
jgi:CheY-like chemotaxis protein